jgi:hypothetical protein
MAKTSAKSVVSVPSVDLSNVVKNFFGDWKSNAQTFDRLLDGNAVNSAKVFAHVTIDKLLNLPNSASQRKALEDARARFVTLRGFSFTDTLDRHHTACAESLKTVKSQESIDSIEMELLSLRVLFASVITCVGLSRHHSFCRKYLAKMESNYRNNGRWEIAFKQAMQPTKEVVSSKSEEQPEQSEESGILYDVN